MSRLSSKIVIDRALPNGSSLPVTFIQSEFDATIRDFGWNVIHEKAYYCSCKSKTATVFQTICLNCGGSGWLWANPTRTKMIIHSISNQKKYTQEGRQDLGTVQITAYEVDKLSQMDRITIVDATSEHGEVLYPALDDSGTKLFALTKYIVKGIDNLALFVSVGAKLQRLTEPADYTFHDNVIEFSSTYNNLVDPSVTIRYTHAPVYYVWDIARDSMRSFEIGVSGKRSLIVLPIHALGRRAHLVQDLENYDGNRLLDNSWLPTLCDTPEFSAFQRQLRNTSMQTIYDSLSSSQQLELELITLGDSNALGEGNDDLIIINP